MNLSYLIATVATRAIGVLTTLILAHLLTGDDFGRFVLITTNAMGLYVVCGAWLVAITTRSLSNSSGVLDEKLWTAIATIIVCVGLFLFAVGAAFQFGVVSTRYDIAACFAFSVVLLVYEINLAVANAIGNARAYAATVVTRNLLALALCAGAVLTGFGATGALIAWASAALIPIILMPNALRMQMMRLEPVSRAAARLWPYAIYGLGGALQVGCYSLTSAAIRNAIAVRYSIEAAGTWGLFTDIFFGAMALPANTYALSKMRLLHIAWATDQRDEIAILSSKLIEFTLVLFAVACIAGVFFAAPLIALVAPAGSSPLSASLALPAAITAAQIILLYSLVSVPLVRNDIWPVGGILTGVVVAMTGGVLVADTLEAMVWNSVIGVFVVLGAASLAVARKYRLVLFKGQLGRVILCLATFLATAAIGETLIDFPFAWVLNAAIAGVIFLASASALRVDSVRDMMSFSSGNQPMRGGGTEP